MSFTKAQRRLLRHGSHLIANHVINWPQRPGKASIVAFWRQTGKGGAFMSAPVIRPAQIMEVPKHFDLTHYKAETIAGRKFVYCPVGNIVSWSPGDYDHEWCEWCKKTFAEIRI